MLPYPSVFDQVRTASYCRYLGRRSDASLLSRLAVNIRDAILRGIHVAREMIEK